MILKQTLVTGSDYPSELEYHLYNDTLEFSNSLQSALEGASLSSAVGLAILLPSHGLLEGIALSVGHTVFILRVNSVTKAQNNAAIEQIMLSSAHRLVGVGFVRLALHIKHALGYHVKGYELFDGSIVIKKSASPGQAVFNYIDMKSDSFRIDQAWDVIPEGYGTPALENMCIRAWLSSV